MPLFDFRCRRCDHAFEALVRKGDVPHCPSCNGTDLERQLPTVAVSTDERRRESVKRERKRQIAGRKDALIAEEEYRQKHDKE
ncbi:MAG: FmdB family transcriptional regulator [Acidobacteria bacterium]|nr:MAG: FmdB family transcriptional regulator [Acidobacteriota bacterium]